MDAATRKKRLGGIGGSEAPAALGLSRFPNSTAYRLWATKRGVEFDEQETAPLLWGKILQEPILRHYEKVTGYIVRAEDEMIWHPVHDFLFCTPDGTAYDPRNDMYRLVEVKTARSDRGWGAAGTSEVPDDPYIQVQHNMFVMGLLVADIPVLFRGSDFRIYTVEADPDLQGEMFTALSAFWKLVQDGIPPEVVSVEDAQMRFSRAREQRVQASPEAIDAVLRLRALKDIEKDTEKLKVLIMREMADADTLVNGLGSVLATWKADSPRKRFNIDRFKKEHPELYEKYAETRTAGRRFLLK